MSIHFPHYAKIKNKYCISYPGNCYEYVLILQHFLPYLEPQYPEIEIYLYFKNYEKDSTISEKELTSNKIHTYCVNYNFQEHPIEIFMKSSEVNIPILASVNENLNKKCFVIRKNSSHAKNITENQYEKIKEIMIQNNLIESNSQEQCDWIIGIEGPEIFNAALSGKHISLVNNGLGTGLFKSMFPHIDVLNI